MHRLEVGFRAFDPHELLPHVLAARLDLYDEAGINVRLRDLTFAAETVVQVSCGAALLSRLQGEPLRIVLVAAQAPLFWVYASEETSLRGKRVAAYPAGSPPDLFTRMLLPDARLEPARDDAARIGLVLAGEVSAAIVSSAEAPVPLEQRGLRQLLAFYARLPIPTTGLAVSEELIARSPEAVTALTSALRRALAVIQSDRATVADTLREVFRYDDESASRCAIAFAAAFSPDGTIDHGRAETAISRVATALGTDTLPTHEVFGATALT